MVLLLDAEREHTAQSQMASEPKVDCGSSRFQEELIGAIVNGIRIRDELGCDVGRDRIIANALPARGSRELTFPPENLIFPE